jgi:hypothetical protein
MTATNRLGVVVPAIPPLPPSLSLLSSALRPDKTSDPDVNSSLRAISPEQLARLPEALRMELEARKGDAWVRGLEWAPENRWAVELRDGCDTTSVDAPPIPAPLKLEGKAKAGGGTVPAEGLEYAVTAVNANGETTGSAILKITPVAEGTITLTWAKSNDTAEYRVYRCKGGVKKPLRIKGAKVPAPTSETTTTVSYTDTGEATEAGKELPVANTTGGKGTYTNLPIAKAIPYVLEAIDRCSTFGFEERDFKGRAERLLENGQHQGLEREWWLGLLAQAKELPNMYLTKKAETGWTPENLTPGGGAPSILRGLQILQDALAECGFGGIGMIHLQRQTATNLLTVVESDPHFSTKENKMYDLFGNLIVPGVGYNGKIGYEGKEAGVGKAWMCATDLVAARVEDKPTIFTPTFAEMTDWGQAGEPNTVTTRAEKFGIAYSDGACGPFWVEVELAK